MPGERARIRAVMLSLFALSCRPAPLSDDESVATDCSALTIAFASGDSDANVTRDIGLPSSGIHGTVVAWSSDNAIRIDQAGKVLRPKNSLGDIPVNLTATVSKGNASVTRRFPLVVIKNHRSYTFKATEETIDDTVTTWLDWLP